MSATSSLRPLTGASCASGPGPALWLAVLLCALPAGAQEQRGSIEGRVLDREGNPVVAVSVVATSAAGATVRAQTDALGVYRFPSLLPGGWALQARLRNLTVAKVEGIDLLLGQLLTADLRIDVLNLIEVVDVTRETPLLDVKQSGRSFNLEAETFEKLPRGRSFTSLVTFAPGANAESRAWGLSIDGATGAENRHLVDGAEITDPEFGGAFPALAMPGTAQTLVLNDFLEEIQVKSAGYAAEFGGSTGSVINMVTRSGSDEWRGDVAFYYNADWLDGDARPILRLDNKDISRARYVTDPQNSYDRWEPGFGLGGPILKHKLWFFAGYHPTFQTTARDVTFLDDVARDMEQRSRIGDGAASLTGQLGDQLRLRLAYNMRNQTFEGEIPLDGANPDVSYDRESHLTSDSLSALFDYFPSTRFFASLRAGWFRSNFNHDADFRGPSFAFVTPNLGLPGVPLELQRPANFFTEDNSFLDRNIRGRLALQLDGTYYFAAAGEHQLKGGVQWTRLTQDALSGSSGPQFVFFWNQRFAGRRGPFGYYQVVGNDLFPELGDIYQADVKSDSVGLFIQDSWTIGKRLTLNLGLRTENEKIPSYAADPRIPSTAIEFGFGEKLAPRLGFAWDVMGDGRWKAYGSWGRYYDDTKLSLPSAYFGGYKANIRWFTLDTPDWPSVARPGCPPACPGQLILGPIDLAFLANDPDANLVDPDVKPMRLREGSLGVEHALTPQISVGLRYLHRKVDVALEDVGAVDEQGNDILVIGNPGRGIASLAHVYPDGSTVPYPEARRSYDSVELTLSKRMANRWSGRLSYLWTRLSGNYTGLTDTEFLSAATPNLNRNFDHPYTMFEETGEPAFGPLGTDRSQQMKLQLVYDLSFGTSAGLHWFARSGIPITRQADFIPGLRVPVPYAGRGSDGNTSFLHSTDLYLQHEVKLGKRMRVAVSLNILNLFDQDTATSYHPFELFFGQAVAIGGDEFFRGFDTESLIAEQRLVRDARFLMERGFQAPRGIRLGMKLSF